MTKPLTCPECGKDQSGIMSIGRSAKPKPGSISICSYCCSINSFQEDFTIKKLTEADLVFAETQQPGIREYLNDLIAAIKHAQKFI
jgi:hypothetical protein